jgi:hypothetical protein
MRGRQKKKLYQQWVDRANLPPNAIPREKEVGRVEPQREKPKSGLLLLYILLGVAVVVLGVGIALLLLHPGW